MRFLYLRTHHLAKHHLTPHVAHQKVSFTNICFGMPDLAIREPGGAQTLGRAITLLFPVTGVPR
jgi:hypothetical protein